MTAYTARGLDHRHRSPLDLLECDTCAIAARIAIDGSTSALSAVDGDDERDLTADELAELRVCSDGGRAA